MPHQPKPPPHVALEKMGKPMPAKVPRKVRKDAGQLKAWEWSKKKRKAVRFVLRGMPKKDIADTLKVDRGTVSKWMQNPEFTAALGSKAREYVESKRYKRVYETGLLTDHLMGLAAKSVAKLKSGQPIEQSDVNLFQAATREYREFREQERSDFGDNVKRVEGSIQIGMGGSGGGVVPAGAVGAQSFKRFMSDNIGKVDPKALEEASKDGNAIGVVAALTRSLLLNTQVLDDIYHEEKDE